MTVRSLFATQLYEAELGHPDLLVALAHSCRKLAEDDVAGIGWSAEHGYRGYTSYASLNDLPQRDPDFADLARILNRHVARFAEGCAFDLGGRRLKLDSLWVNILAPGGQHSAHIHPHSAVSGTLYVEVPEGAGGIRYEDPRHTAMMAAPLRRTDAPEMLAPYVTVQPRPGLILLWESWLRHEVQPNGAASERISISFNYR